MENIVCIKPFWLDTVKKVTSTEDLCLSPSCKQLYYIECIVIDYNQIPVLFDITSRDLELSGASKVLVTPNDNNLYFARATRWFDLKTTGYETLNIAAQFVVPGDDDHKVRAFACAYVEV